MDTRRNNAKVRSWNQEIAECVQNEPFEYLDRFQVLNLLLVSVVCSDDYFSAVAPYPVQQRRD